MKIDGQALGNGGNGIVITDTPAANNTIDANIIAFNTLAGVAIESETGNTVQSNSIFSNGALGIDLGIDGVTPNDAMDADTGANNLQNFPLLTSAVTDGVGTVIQGTLNSTPNTTFTIRFSSSNGCDPSGNGEGLAPAGQTTVMSDGAGNAPRSSAE